jgi:hypothetical protein
VKRKALLLLIGTLPLTVLLAGPSTATQRTDDPLPCVECSFLGSGLTDDPLPCVECSFLGSSVADDPLPCVECS